ncbi:LuxR family transcriptional regulator [Methylobacterium durans]|uniref:helix-turn-helix transcriptional regulator n=1 Tax=Methylobacterium durans TaxID=2202825 RepID=UPI002AFF9EEF|nr:LuxR family transcriptional regulator [Methylobacterium durans]MEA1834903.1 LuxR family transcriptional regulator [Methylobacterium durans]
MDEQGVDLIDRVYEAAAIPELWPSVLSQVAKFSGSEGAVLFTIDRDDFRSVATPNLTDTVAAYVEEGWPARTDRTARLIAKRHAGFVTDLDVYTQAEFEREAVFREFFRPRGFGMGAATVVNVPTGDQLIFDIERAIAEGPIPREMVGRLDGLRPHLARAATMSARLRMQTVRAAAQALDTVGLPAAVLGRRGQILALNGGCEALLQGAIQDGRRLRLLNPAADRLLAQALAELSTEARSSVRSIPLPAREEHAPTILHLLPIRRAAEDLFAAASAIALFTPLSERPIPTLSVLEGLFDLTGAEARVARGIAECRSVAELAGDFGVTQATLRSQLKAVMRKTGVGRQAELVDLFSGRGAPAAK